MKNKETLEEASKRAVKSGLFKDETLFIAAAKWQQERSYSEEEMRIAIQKTIALMRCKFAYFREHENTIMEQFKKKNN